MLKISGQGILIFNVFTILDPHYIVLSQCWTDDMVDFVQCSLLASKDIVARFSTFFMVSKKPGSNMTRQKRFIKFFCFCEDFEKIFCPYMIHRSVHIVQCTLCTVYTTV